MSLNAALHRPAARAVVSGTLLAGIVTSVVAAYQGYETLASPAQPAMARSAGADGDGVVAVPRQPAAPALASTSHGDRTAVRTRTPETGWSAGAVPGWGMTPAAMPQAVPGWMAAPGTSMPAFPGSAGGWSPATPPWAVGRPPPGGRPAMSPSPGPSRTGGKACGVGFGMGFG
jgi:hypothetical protein